ncbi:MAG: Superoxide dismutase [Cu-Zn] precursor [uncultured Gemmatimonadetes bacterium]|uniref:Superoxide dismutase [Cu-Zn] n=1 Tax=uncultured Gemmatimonadota bacterium TaxID=203437 RepID=A0A6J4KC96_9BACT|nr:MAG: Superoxide dismutase [Cu-Zn] precursor [uncultured Gemmatimonadota bacterium]
MRTMRRSAWLAGGALMALGACAPAGQAGEGEMRPRQFTAPLMDAQGRNVGTVTATQRGGNVHVQVAATGLPAGTHGTHLHEAGICAAPGFTTAGGHLNPTGRQHGMRNPNGPHLGDLPNLTVGADGRGSMEATVAGTLTPGQAPLFDANGTALVVHATADDMVTDPSGNSGARIACVVLAAPTQ